MDEAEKLDVLADGSVNDAKKILQQEEIESNLKREKVLDFVSSQKKIVDYNPLIANLLLKRLALVDWQEFTYNVSPTDKGVVMELYSPKKEIFRAAFATVRSPLDVRAIDNFAIRAQNTVDGWYDKQGSPDPKNTRS